MLNEKRGKNVAAAGAALQAVFTGVVLGMWLWTGSRTVMACGVVLAGGSVAWLVVSLLFYARQLERREAMELEEIAARTGGAGSVFEGEGGEETKPASARREWMDRWVAPGFTLLWAAYNAGMGLLLLRYAGAPPQIANAAQGILFLVLVGFVGFLFGRYAIGMSSQPDWCFLRAPAGHMLFGVLLILLCIASLVTAMQGYPDLDRVLAYLVPALQVVLAVELALNFILDLYRPRVPGQEHRPSFDSRLLNLLAEPARAGHSIAEALNYQFGFEVSKTWFYKLLRRALVPLIVTGAVVLVLLDCVVVVQDGQTCLLKRWGRLVADPSAALRPGVHLKWPWPVASVGRFQTGKVHRVALGEGAERTEEERQADIVNGRELYLWTAEHGLRKELDFLVGLEQEAAAAVTGAPAAADEAAKTRPQHAQIIKLVVDVQYEIRSPSDYGYRYADPGRVVECVAYREMTNYCASATLDQPLKGGPTDRPEAIMTFGRHRAAEELRLRIQNALDRLDMGVQVVHVAIRGAHPPAEAAPAFEGVAEAERRRLEQQYEAEAEANRVLAEAAGTPEKAMDLALAIRVLRDFENVGGVRNNPQESRRMLDQYIQDVNNQIRDLARSIELEMMTGRIARAQDSPRSRLKEAWQAHLRVLERIRDGQDAPDLDQAVSEARQRAEEVFATARGQAAARVADARLDSWRKELEQRGRALAYERRLQAFRAGGWAYTSDRAMEVMSRYLPGIPKYVLGLSEDRIRNMTTLLNLERRAGLMEGFSFEQAKPTGQ